MLLKEDYEFICVNVFSEEGQNIIAQYSTARRVPLLIDEGIVIWDSLLIANYLSEDQLSLDTQKNLVLINEMTDAGIQLFQLRKFNIDPEDKGEFSINNLKRIASILDYFESAAPKTWDIIGKWLYCTLDWMVLRGIYPWQNHHPKLNQFYLTFNSLDEVKATDPRN